MTGTPGNFNSALLVQARPRVVAALVRQFRDVDIAEDLYQEACVRALQAWSAGGAPRDPVAWLIRTGRNAGIDQIRRRKRQSSEPAETILEKQVPENDREAEIVEDIDARAYPDDVLRLMFMCCHAELAPPDQLALALKVVVGFSVDEVARALLVSPKAMEQRITRAKKRASDVASGLEVPSMQERARRLHAVTRMVYLLFNEGYSAAGGDEHIRHVLCDEAIRLARLMLELFPGQAELMGLLALSLLQHSRHRARLNPDGAIITLDRQDRTLWDREMIAEGLVLVEKALRKGQPGPFQIQAAIAAVHCRAATSGAPDWAEIDNLYRALEVIEPSPVITLNRSVAVEKLKGPAAALQMLEPLEEALKAYRPYHSTRAAFFEALDEFSTARAAYEVALGCATSTAESDYLSEKITEMTKKLN